MSNLAEYLAKRSKEICQDHGCTEENHYCESYAYITGDGQLIDICCSDYFPGSSQPYAAVPLPWEGTQEELNKEIEEQTYNEE